MKREFISPEFSLLQYWLLRRENQASLEENAKCPSISHRVQIEESNLKNVFFQLDHVHSKHELPLSYMVVVVTIVWPLMQIYSKQSPERRNYLQHFLADSYLKHSCIKTDAVQQCTWVRHAVTSLKEWEMHLWATNPMIHHHRTVITNTPTWTWCESWHGSYWQSLWTPIPLINTMWLLFGGSLKDKAYKTNPHTLKELWNNIRCGISTISSKNTRE